MVGPGELDEDVPAIVARASEYKTLQAAAKRRAKALIAELDRIANAYPQA
jgi:hypothetical protein